MKTRVTCSWAGLLLLVCAMGLPRTARAWSDHTLGAYPALARLPEVKDAPAVVPESLEQFLEAEQGALVQLLKDEEAWDRQHVPGYPPRPDALELKAGGTDDLRSRFLRAIRVNPNIKTPAYVQPLPGADPAGRTPLPGQEVTLVKSDETVAHTLYLLLPEGAPVSALEVVATAADEPDYGLDIGLFEDNGTEFGKSYGFGQQPFGNPVLDYGSQAPFHMGFYHEAGIVYALAGFLERSWPEYRLHMYLTLARHAFKTGHDYWGWRFTGWGLHYIQDLTQPYHAQVLPGVSVPKMLWINMLNMIGVKKPQTRAVQLVTNRHLALEDYEYETLEAVYQAGRADAPVLAALEGDGHDARFGAYTPAYPRGALTAESAGRSKETDRSLEKWMPERLVDDLEYIFDQTETGVNTLAEVQAGPPEGQAGMQALLNQLMASFGAHSRNYVRAVRAP